MKKFYAKKLALCAVVAGAMVCPLGLSGCAATGNAKAKGYAVYMPDGAPALALSGLMNGGYAGANFTVVGADTIVAHVANGDADFAVMPINAAAKLYNGGVDIVMLTVNTHGNLYIIGNGDSFALSDLKGKRLGVIGQGNVPDLTLKMLLEKSDISYTVSDSAVSDGVAIRYVEDGPSLAPQFQLGNVDYGLLAEPAVTNLCGKLGKNIVMDVQEEWKTAFGTEYPQACLVVKGSVLANDKAFVDKFIADLIASDGWAERFPDPAVTVINTNLEEGLTPSLKTLDAKTVERCNIKTVTAADSKQACTAYFEMLTHLVSATGTPVLNALPDDGFYYKG